MATHHYVECECDSAEHVVRLSTDSGDDIWPMWFEFHLIQYRPWYKRIWVAVRYVFGYKSKYGDFDTCCPTKESVHKMIEVMQKAYKL